MTINILYQNYRGRQPAPNNYSFANNEKEMWKGGKSLIEFEKAYEEQ